MITKYIPTGITVKEANAPVVINVNQTRRFLCLFLKPFMEIVFSVMKNTQRGVGPPGQ
jgi:hypothetical protein